MTCLQSYTRTTCFIPFLDCRGYYDLAAELIAIVISCYIFIRVLGNYRDLKVEKSNTEEMSYINNISQKLKINKLNLAFLLLFVCHLIFSMIIFQIINQSDQESKIINITSCRLQYWYKFTNIMVIEMLNCLVLAIGWLYWGTLHSFYKIKGLKIPAIYGYSVRYVVIAVVIFMVGIVVISFLQAIMEEWQLDTITNWLVMSSVMLATTFFVSFRMIYYHNIFKSVKMTAKTIRRQHIYNVIIVIASLGRISLCLLKASGADFDDLRKYDMKQCYDTRPFYALVLLAISVVIDLLPSFIFTRIFGGLDRRRNRNHIENTLFSAMLSQSSGM